MVQAINLNVKNLGLYKVGIDPDLIDVRNIELRNMYLTWQ